MASQWAVPGLQQQRLQPESALRGNERLMEPAGQKDHAEVRGHCVSHFLQDCLLQEELPTERVQQHLRDFT